VKKLLSIIIPAYNEEANLPVVFSRVNALFEGQLSSYELEAIVLDNASTDATEQVATGFTVSNKRWKYVRYSRNFGADVSMTAGLDFATGDAVVNLFSDLQDPPEMIPEFVKAWEAGAEVVNGVVRERNDGNLLKTLGAKIGYALISKLSEYSLKPGATDFRLLDKKVVHVLRGMRERDRYMKGLVGWVGFKRTLISYDRAPREKGESSAGLVFCLLYAFNAIVCFSGKPLHFATLFGFIVTLLSIFLGVLYPVLYFLKPSFLTVAPPGITTIIVLLVFSLGLQSLFLGLIGEYLARVYNQGKNRPLYVVERIEGVSQKILETNLI
jgi:dolichol-phosphate mannosyltransferase